VVLRDLVVQRQRTVRMLRIPRFSPSFSPLELGASLKALIHPDDDSPIGQFEQAFAEYIGVRHAIMVASARMGASLLVRGWGLEPGDEVLLPGLTYFSIPSILIPLGIKPVFVDIDRDTYLMDPVDLERKITKRSKVVIPTHLYGFPCALDPILKLAWSHQIKVLEDCAQATGARYHGKRLGSFGDAAYYTFGLTKNITTLKGGMVTTDDDELAGFIRKETAGHSPIGVKPLVKEIVTGAAMMVGTHRHVYPLTLHPLVSILNRTTGKDFIHTAFQEAEVLYTEEPDWFRSSHPRGTQGAVGLVQLQRIDQLNGLRAAHGQFLIENLSHVPDIRVPKFVEGAEPIYMSFPIQVAHREKVARHLFKHGIDTSIGYMRNCSSAPIFQGRVEGDCPNASAVEREILHIPVHPNLNQKALTHLVESVRRAVLKV